MCGRWPKTLAGILAFLPCAPATFGSAPHPSGSAPHPSSQREKKAWRRCDRAGRWAEEDYTQCPYASELTRVLHELTQVSVHMENLCRDSFKFCSTLVSIVSESVLILQVYYDVQHVDFYIFANLLRQFNCKI